VGIEPPDAKETKDLFDYKELKMQEVQPMAGP
jgi:hypothetical protein